MPLCVLRSVGQCISSIGVSEDKSYEEKKNFIILRMVALRELSDYGQKRTPEDGDAKRGSVGEKLF